MRSESGIVLKPVSYGRHQGGVRRGERGRREGQEQQQEHG
jgi:hypothetical protein